MIEIVARSEAMREAVRLAERVAETDANVLITGESGVGKDALAFYVHGKSSRGEQSFVKIDCATLPAFRGKLLYSALLVYMLGELRAQNLCTVWIGADLDNLASQKGMARAGFQHVADLVIERVLAMRQVWVTGLPDVPEAIVAEARRAFLNDRDQVWWEPGSSTVKEDRE